MYNGFQPDLNTRFELFMILKKRLIMEPKVMIILGSSSDFKIAEKAIAIL